jgi:23S rRNA (uracil1939-C5)-methyltransferase
MTDCKLQSERGNELREQVLAFCREQGLGAWDRKTQQGFLRNLVIREGAKTGQFQVRLITSPGELDAERLAGAVDADGVLWTQTESLGESTQGGSTRLLSGSPQLMDDLGDLRFLISPEAFFRRTRRWRRSSTARRWSSPASRVTSRSSTSTAGSARSRSRSRRARGPSSASS